MRPAIYEGDMSEVRTVRAQRFAVGRANLQHLRLGGQLLQACREAVLPHRSAGWGPALSMSCKRPLPIPAHPAPPERLRPLQQRGWQACLGRDAPACSSLCRRAETVIA
eukprot:212745-Chlamydomonas_euryale.AAC.3